MGLASILGWFGGGTKAADTIIDGAVAGIDKLVFTDEERSELRGKLAEQWIELQKTLGEETSVRGVTRRILAVMFSSIYILFSVASVIIWPFWKEYADFIWDVANNVYGYITLAIVAFYFGPYFLSQLVERFMGKKG